MFSWFKGRRVYVNEIHVIDGDSINWRPGGWDKGDDGNIRYRLAGFDSPELRKAKSENEAEWAAEAREFLKRLVMGAGKMRLKETGERTPHGDPVARLFIDGRDVRDIMIEAGQGKKVQLKESGHAERYKWDETKD